MVRVLLTSTKDFERAAFERLGGEMRSAGFQWSFEEFSLTALTAHRVRDCDCVCVFVSDKLDRECLEILARNQVRLIALRSAGFNHVDLTAARELGLTVVRVPKYSPEAVAEFAIGLYLCLNRKIHRSSDRVHHGNFSLDGMVGHNVSGQTAGIIGTGNIGKCVAQIFRGFGARVLAFEPFPEYEWAKKNQIQYVTLDELLRESDVVSLHVPLTLQTRHLINESAVEKMKTGAYLVNTSRGGLIDTPVLIKALKMKKLAGAALDVYEEEEHIFFFDHSEDIIDDDCFAVLNSLPNVLMTSHQAFLTEEALMQIARTTLENILDFFENKELPNRL